jgi:hypothetical protein
VNSEAFWIWSSQLAKADCTTTVRDSKVKVAENGKQAIFLNPKRRPFTKTRVDGCVIVNSVACDWLVQDDDVTSILIELKGCDVDHAIEQIEATLSFMKANALLTKQIAALIVCSKPSRHPSFTAKLQKAKARISLQYKAPLHVVTGSHEFEMERLLSHAGPR